LNQLIPSRRFLGVWAMIFVLVALITLLFLRHISSSYTLLSSPSSLAALLAAPSDQPFLWQSHTWPSMKYRVLFHFIVETTSSLIMPRDTWTFYWSFVGWSFAFMVGTLLALWKWLDLLAFSPWQRFLGCLLFLSSFPVVFAYDYPIFTREDPLAYLLVVLSLIAATTSHRINFILFSTLGTMTRETTLVVPFCYMLVGSERFQRRLLYTLPSFVVFFLVRALLGYESYNPFVGARVNFDRPLEAFIFLFLTFGVVWLLALLRWSELWKTRSLLPIQKRTLYLYTPLAVVSLLFATSTMGAFRENRISFLLFPFIIIWALNWVSAHVNELLAFWHNRWLFVAWVGLTLSVVVLSQLMLADPKWVESMLPVSIQARLIGGHTSIPKLLASYPDIRWWIVYLVIQYMLVLMVAAICLRPLPNTDRGNTPRAI